jgi:hypothetical protein
MQAPAFRTLALALALVGGPLVASGCLDVIGCWGEADWTEPGIHEWLLVNGSAAGFSPTMPLNASSHSAHVDAALPPDAVLDTVMRKAVIQGAETTFYHSHEVVFVSAWSGPQGGTVRVDAESMARFLGDSLRRVYRGSNESRDAALATARLQWGQDLEPSFRSANLRLDDSWDFDPVFPAGTTFQAEDFGWRVDVGDWYFHAQLPQWGFHPSSWTSYHDLRINVRGEAHLDTTKIKTDEAARQLVLDAAPSYPWTFQGFDHKTNCR